MHRSLSNKMIRSARAATTKPRVMLRLHRRRRFSAVGGTMMNQNSLPEHRSSSSSSSRNRTIDRTNALDTTSYSSFSSSIGNNSFRHDTNHCMLRNSRSNKNNSIRMFSTALIDNDNDNDSDSDNEGGNNDTLTRSGVRNVAIIAHVDHGKTTLVDQLLRSAEGNGSISNNNDDTDRLLDCGDLEKERGITITSKVTRIENYTPTTNTSNNTSNTATSSSNTINLVDTPGHADFCGEVDRVLSLVDGVCLVVDAGEGPMAQTKYVLSRALQAGLPIVVVLNKVDRKVSFDKVMDGDTEISLEELMEQLGASQEQIRFSLDKAVFYASARDGWITQDLDVLREIVEGCDDDDHEPDEKKQNKNKSDENNTEATTSMALLLDRLLELIPEPSVTVHNTANDDGSSMPGEAFANDRFSMAAVTVGYDSYLGRTCTGRITSGHVTTSDSVTVLKRRENNDGDNDAETAAAADAYAAQAAVVPPTTLKGLFVNKGISRVPLESQVAYAGDICTLAGVPDSIRVGDTITCSDLERRVNRAVHTPPLVPPTLSMEFAANNGPLAGTEGTEVTPSKLRNRLVSETDNNVTLTVESSVRDSEKTNVYARGELQLGILIEQMRREGFEMIISPPSIVTKTDETTGTVMEPYEEVTIDVDAEYSGYIVSALTSDRKGVLLEMNESADLTKTRLVFEVPSRGLLGFPSEAAAMTRGSAIVNHVYLEDRKHAGLLGEGLEKGKLISSERGKATTYALASLAARGILFIEPGDTVYPGMILGENAKQGDLEVNPVRAKAANNMRTQNKEEKVYLSPPKKMTIEEMIGYMAPDEMIEVTPTTLRLRKASLDPVERKKAGRAKKQQQDAKKRK